MKMNENASVWRAAGRRGGKLNAVRLKAEWSCGELREGEWRTAEWRRNRER